MYDFCENLLSYTIKVDFLRTYCYTLNAVRYPYDVPVIYRHSHLAPTTVRKGISSGI